MSNAVAHTIANRSCLRRAPVEVCPHGRYLGPLIHRHLVVVIRAVHEGSAHRHPGGQEGVRRGVNGQVK
eukprot:1180329-Prorocentrum_minimum.AAC.1